MAPGGGGAHTGERKRNFVSLLKAMILFYEQYEIRRK